jgi:hypothetical protein
MDGTQFVDILREFGIRVGAVTEVQWKGKQEFHLLFCETHSINSNLRSSPLR